MALGRSIEFSDEKNDAPLNAPLGRKIQFSEPQISKLKSIGNAFAKGLLKGGHQISPILRGSPITPKLQENILNQFLPSREEFTEKAVERGGKLIPSAIFPGGSAAGVGRALLGGVLGQTAEALGGGELAQALSEGAAFGLPSFGRKIVAAKGQEKLVNYARKAGLSEKEIAPMIPGEKKKAFFGKIAHKGTKTQKALWDSKQAVGRAYDFVKSNPEAQKSLTPQNANKFLTDSAKIAYQMPFEVRKQMLQDAKDLVNTGYTGEGLVNFYQDISSKYKMGREQLERLKGPVVEAIESISPELAEDFKLTNELFKKRIGISKKLKPDISSQLMDLGELGKFAHDVMTMSVKGISQVMGLSAARRMAREMLINPRLQNIGKQMEKAAREHKFPAVLKLADYLKHRFSEEKED